MTPRRVVITRSLGLGDLCTAVPALRAIRRAFPNHEVVLAAPAWSWPIARRCGVDRVEHLCGLDPLPEHLRGPDLAINLHGRGPESIRRLVLLEPRRLITYRHHDMAASADGPLWCDAEHEVDRWCRLLTCASIPCDVEDLHLSADVPAPELAVSRPVVIHPGAAAAGRRWPAERFADVARQLIPLGLPVVLTGSDSERSLCDQVVVGIADPPVADPVAGQARSLAGRTDLEQLLALVAGARLVIANDSGVAHLATATRTPSVVLFGPTSPTLWGPRRGPHIAIWHGRRGDPHASTLDPGLASITPHEVLEAAQTLTRHVALPGE